MGIFLNRGNEEFDNVVNSKIYVDKTDMIGYLNEVINTEQRYICVSRPRRFGKTIAANMIAAYYETGCDSRYIFEGRKLGQIENWDKHLNKYDVIRIDLAEQRSSVGSPELALDYIEKNVLKELAEKFEEVNMAGLNFSQALAKINDVLGMKFIIIIDEWDAFFRDEKSNKEVQNRYVDLLRSLFKGNSSKKFLALAYITGILPIKRYNSESALNNFDEFTMLSPKNLVKYIGFSEDEVVNLCNEYEMDIENVKKWYDGYVYENEKHVYSPNSVVKAMLYKSVENYWSKTVAFNSLLTYITMNFDGLKDSIMAMIGGARVELDVSGFENDMVSFKGKDDVLTVLIHLGYLAYDREREEAYIPNKEVKEIFERNLKYSGWDDVIEMIDASEDLLEDTIDMDEEAVAEAIEEVHTKNSSILRYNNENALSCTITLAYYTAKKEYTIIREVPTGKGFADLVFLPKPGVDRPAIIIELKWNKEVETALDQIKENKYVSALEGYHGKLLLVGITYEKAKRREKTKKHTCKIEEIQI